MKTSIAFAPETFASDASTLWKLTPHRLDHNRHGLRGPWFEPHKGAREFRLMAIGDSCTYGTGVPRVRSWSMQLERRMQQAMPARVVTAASVAVPGWSSWQNRVKLIEVLDDAQPDLVVFYCGAWNDHMPAVGASDAELTATSSVSRLAALLLSVTRPDAEACLDAFAHGETPYGRRVEPEDFTANLVAMAAACKAKGAKLAFVNPGHPTATRAGHPLLSEYRRRVAEVAAEHDAVCVDMDEVAQRLDPSRGRRDPQSPDPCYLDWVHPAANLQDALAEALVAGLDLASAAESFAQSCADAPLATIDPDDGDLVAPWPMGDAGCIRRAWVGPLTLADLRLVGGLLRWRPSEAFPPGEHAVWVATDRGAAAAFRMSLAPRPLVVRREQEADAVRLHVEGRGQPGGLAWIWLSEHRRDVPLSTPCGALWLPLADLPDSVGGLVRFDLAAQGRWQAAVGDDGRFVLSLPWPADDGPARPLLHVQALALDLSNLGGALSEPACVSGESPHRK